MTNDQRPADQASVRPPRRWPFTFTQVRLGVLMAALAFGITGMVRNDVRLLDVGIGLAVVGVGMRLWRRFKQGQGHWQR